MRGKQPRQLKRLSDGKVFASAVEAAAACGIHHSGIRNAANNNTVAAGSKWAYVDGGTAGSARRPDPRPSVKRSIGSTRTKSPAASPDASSPAHGRDYSLAIAQPDPASQGFSFLPAFEILNRCLQLSPSEWRELRSVVDRLKQIDPHSPNPTP